MVLFEPYIKLPINHILYIKFFTKDSNYKSLWFSHSLIDSFTSPLPALHTHGDTIPLSVVSGHWDSCFWYPDVLDFLSWPEDQVIPCSMAGRVLCLCWLLSHVKFSWSISVKCNSPLHFSVPYVHFWDLLLQEEWYVFGSPWDLRILSLSYFSF